MNVAVFGLGYVGCISAACLAMHGHRVYGVDVNQTKVDLINQGKSPIIEERINEIIADVCAAGRLTATQDAAVAVRNSDIALVCVGTPSQANGNLDLAYVEKVARDIGAALRARDEHYVVAVRSTMLPGSVESVVIPALENASSKRFNEDFGVCINPEFLREGTAVADYLQPPYTLVGAGDERSAEQVSKLYAELEAPLFVTEIRTAEMVKYSCNAFHALKITFANEVGLLCKEMQIDSHAVMEIFTQDTSLNISSKYLRPGFAFGGSCLPKDLRAISYRAKTLDLDVPVLTSILASNQRHLDYAFNLVHSEAKRRVGVLGLSFKAGTDDLRESPTVALIERLIGKGYDIRIYDHNVSLARIVGANKRYIEQVIPHISSLLVPSMGEVMDHAEVIVIGNDAAEFETVLKQAKPQQKIVDLVRITEDVGQLRCDYSGLCW